MGGAPESAQVLRKPAQSGRLPHRSSAQVWRLRLPHPAVGSPLKARPKWPHLCASRPDLAPISPRSRPDLDPRSRGATVLSEHAYPKDEAEYEGLVHFGRVAELPSMLSSQLIPSQPPTPWRHEPVRSMQSRPQVPRRVLLPMASLTAHDHPT